MKTTILYGLMLTILGFSINATTADDMKSFIKLVKDQKSAWFDFEKQKDGAKYDLLKKQHNKMFDEKLSGLSKLESGDILKNGLSGDKVQGVLADKLEGAIKYYADQMKEWEQLCNTWHQKGLELGKQHKDAFEKFISQRSQTQDKQHTEDMTDTKTIKTA